ncbi:MAG TPA: hypothetical protein PLI04_04645 [Verrucomicrobiota bacterium]|nr:hypothetical protein [Limisphaerales bacterium]HOS75482.1 hypothetical protein [Verrucomicrobiota bacterium]HQE89438.1 hypothetical protein [Verrucomicrobiota bacterium]HQH02023.1 hypothetical protein [Verrucomicrobiota bacterium]HQJ47856.1 hypothetical protein [Verrucomicrobiota bacterium]
MKKNLLVISDDPARQDALTALLEREGYGVTRSKTGRPAAALLAARPVNLVVVDFTTAPNASGRAGHASRTLQALTDVDPFLPLLLLCKREDELDDSTQFMADMVLTDKAATPVLLDAIETLLSESLRERAQRKAGHVALFR